MVRWQAFVQTWRKNGEGLRYAALANEVAAQPQSARHEMIESLRTTIELMAATAQERRAAALAAMPSITGAEMLKTSQISSYAKVDLISDPLKKTRDKAVRSVFLSRFRSTGSK